MSTLLENIEKQARLLTLREKAELARILIADLEPAVDHEVDQLWLDESKRRYEAYLKGEIRAVPGEEVMARVRSRLK